MKIEWTLDEEGEWEPYSLLGDISITDEDGNIIEEKSTYLDTWFPVISDGLQALKNDKEKTIDLLEESYPLCFTIKKSTKYIGYKDKEIMILNIAEAITDLRKEVQGFLNSVLSHPEPRDETVIDNLRKILNL